MWRQTRLDDPKAFRLLYEKTVLSLTNRSYRILKDLDLTKDVLQDVYSSLYAKRKELPADLNVEGYLQNAVKYKLSNILRDKVSKMGHYEELSKRYQQPEPDQAVLYEKKELNQQIGTSLQALPDKCRQAFVLSHFDNLSYKAVAHEMGISVKTVEKHISKALRTLRKEFT